MSVRWIAYLVSRHRSSVGLRWPSKRIAALHRWTIRSVWAARCALRCAPMAARSLRHLTDDATLTQKRLPLSQAPRDAHILADPLQAVKIQRLRLRQRRQRRQLRHAQA